MQNKKYPKAYQQIQAYYTLVAEYHTLPDIQDFIRRCTNNAYRTACSLIRTGKFTEEQIIAAYPLD